MESSVTSVTGGGVESGKFFFVFLLLLSSSTILSSVSSPRDCPKAFALDVPACSSPVGSMSIERTESWSFILREERVQAKVRNNLC